MKNSVKPEMKEVETSLIDRPGEMAREQIDPEYIKELSESIKAIGLLEPILIRPKENRYEIIAGHCRFLAVSSLGWERINCVISEMDDTTTVMARATENLARKDISPIE